MQTLFERFRDFAREKNLLPKAVCLLLSIMLWALISRSQSTMMRLRVPIETKNLSSQLTVAQMSNKYVFVNFKGKREYLSNLNLKNVKAYIDLSEPQIGEFKNYQIQFTRQRIPESIQITPSLKDVNAKVERIREKWVKVIPRIVGSVNPGRMIGKWSVNPEYVFVSGAASVVKNLNYLYTDDISIENEDGVLERKVELVLDDYEGLNV